MDVDILNIQLSPVSEKDITYPGQRGSAKISKDMLSETENCLNLLGNYCRKSAKQDPGIICNSAALLRKTGLKQNTATTNVDSTTTVEKIILCEKPHCNQ